MEKYIIITCWGLLVVGMILLLYLLFRWMMSNFSLANPFGGAAAPYLFVLISVILILLSLFLLDKLCPDLISEIPSPQKQRVLHSSSESKQDTMSYQAVPEYGRKLFGNNTGEAVESISGVPALLAYRSFPAKQRVHFGKSLRRHPAFGERALLYNRGGFSKCKRCSLPNLQQQQVLPQSTVFPYSSVSHLSNPMLRNSNIKNKICLVNCQRLSKKTGLILKRLTRLSPENHLERIQIGTT
jgi:hypothetical protein